jgi:hypothetical protein
MPWEPEHNRRSLSPHGLKAAEGHAAPGVHDMNSVPCPEMPPGITGAPLNADPHARGFTMPVHIAPSAARPRNDMGPPVHPGGVLNADPHPYNPASQVQQRNTYAAPTWERKLK